MNKVPNDALGFKANIGCCLEIKMQLSYVVYPTRMDTFIVKRLDTFIVKRLLTSIVKRLDTFIVKRLDTFIVVFDQVCVVVYAL
jgi:hypothetical protein